MEIQPELLNEMEDHRKKAIYWRIRRKKNIIAELLFKYHEKKYKYIALEIIESYEFNFLQNVLKYAQNKL